MNQLIQITERAIEHKTSIVVTPATTTCGETSSRVPLHTNNSNNTCQTRSTTQSNPQLPTISTLSVPRVEQSKKVKSEHRIKRHKSAFNTTSPAHNTRSRAWTSATPPASRMRAHTLLTRMENKTQKGKSSKLETTISQLENNIHQDLAVMDTDTGKPLDSDI